MKNTFPLLFLAVAFAIALSGKSIAQTNKTAPLILPEAKWDFTGHKLALLISTNQPGDYPLPAKWVGTEEITVRSGKLASEDSFAGPRIQSLEVDRFTLKPGTGDPFWRETRILSKSEESPSYAFYMATLPEDSELLAIRDLSSVSNLIGSKLLMTELPEGVLTVRIRFFTLLPYNWIETVQVTFIKKGREPDINSVVIRRGRLHPQSKAP